MSDTAAPARIAVRKTYKLYIGGAFPRSESGRSYVVTDQKDRFLANAALASRKDARDDDHKGASRSADLGHRSAERRDDEAAHNGAIDAGLWRHA